MPHHCRLPCSFHTDPSGTYVKYEAKAIGSGSEGAQTALQESYRCALAGALGGRAAGRGGDGGGAGTALMHCVGRACRTLLALALLPLCSKDMTLKEAEVLALSTLKQVMEEKVAGGCSRAGPPRVRRRGAWWQREGRGSAAGQDCELHRQRCCYRFRQVAALRSAVSLLCRTTQRPLR